MQVNLTLDWDATRCLSTEDLVDELTKLGVKEFNPASVRLFRVACGEIEETQWQAIDAHPWVSSLEKAEPHRRD